MGDSPGVGRKRQWVSRWGGGVDNGEIDNRGPAFLPMQYQEISRMVPPNTMFPKAVWDTAFLPHTNEGHLVWYLHRGFEPLWTCTLF